MTLQEIKDAVESLTTEERKQLATYMKLRTRSDDPAYKAELTRIVDECTGDKAISWEEAKQRLDELDESKASQ
ncbi:MAG: hypothetical protein ACFB20_06085 [Opitutales bacterium]